MNVKRTIVYVAGFLFSVPLALTSYINSSFLQGYVSQQYVGIIYACAAFITIIGLLEMPHILTRFGNRKTTLYFGMLAFFALVMLYSAHTAGVAIPAFILYFICCNFIIANLDIFIEDFSKDQSIGKLRGLYLVTTNSAWVLAQIISGSVIAKSSFAGIYLIAACSMFIVCLIFLFGLHSFRDPHYAKVSMRKTIQAFIRNKNISKIYWINFILKFFFAWMIIYTPIYLHQYMGFAWNQIGIIFTIMLLPFVILEFPLGKLSDKIGEKKMLLAGFLMATIPTICIPLVTAQKIWIWALLLFTTRIGAATIEVMSESYFFKSVTEKNDDEISFFRNTNPLSFLVAPLIAVPLLFLLPSFKYLFFVLGAILLLGFFITLRLRDVK